LEEELGLPLDEAEACTAFLDKMKQDESRNTAIHTNLITGSSPDSCPNPIRQKQPTPRIVHTLPGRFFLYGQLIISHHIKCQFWNFGGRQMARSLAGDRDGLWRTTMVESG
jgi:hypothetical protein